MKNLLELNNLILIHQLLKNQIQTIGYIKTLNTCKNIVSKTQFQSKISKKRAYEYINRKINKLLAEEEKGNLITSCISLSLLIHILLFTYNIKSHIIIGVFCVNNSNIISHAWVKTEDDTIFNFHYDNIKYKEITKLSIWE